MTRDLPPYGYENPCAKCGNDSSDTKYICVSNTRIDDGEWLQRECCRCRYVWDEAVLGASSQHSEAGLRFEAGKAYRRIEPGFVDSKVIVYSVTDEKAIGMWWDGDPWTRPQRHRSVWKEME